MTPASHHLNRYPETPVKKWWLPRFLGMIAMVLIVIQVIISNQLATTGLHISEIETDIAAVSSTNADLRQEIASASALRTIELKAHELGFVKTTKPVYLAKDLPVALDLR